MRECDKLISNPEGYKEIQVKAMDVLIRAIKVCYGIVVDVVIEQLEEDITGLTARYRELAEAGGRDRQVEEVILDSRGSPREHRRVLPRIPLL